MISTKEKAINLYNKLIDQARFYGDLKEVRRYEYYIKNYDSTEAEDNQEDEFNKEY